MRQAYPRCARLASGTAGRWPRPRLLASIVVALANVLVRRHLLAVSPIAMTTGQAAIGAAALLAAATVAERGAPVAFTPPAMAALVYLALFATALNYIGLYWLVPRVPIAAIGAIPLLDTTVAVALGALLLDEEVGWHLALGGALVLAGAALASRPAPGAGAAPPRAPVGSPRAPV